MSFSYNPQYVKRVRALRKQQTNTEKFFWAKIRGRQIAGFKFYRQYPIGRYILDFYCPERKIAVELDGSQHMEERKQDEIRSKYLKSQNITVVRFWDNEILQNVESVLDKVYSYLKTSP